MTGVVGKAAALLPAPAAAAGHPTTTTTPPVYPQTASVAADIHFIREENADLIVLGTCRCTCSICGRRWQRAEGGRVEKQTNKTTTTTNDDDDFRTRTPSSAAFHRPQGLSTTTTNDDDDFRTRTPSSA